MRTPVKYYGFRSKTDFLASTLPQLDEPRFLSTVYSYYWTSSSLAALRVAEWFGLRSNDYQNWTSSHRCFDVFFKLWKRETSKVGLLWLPQRCWDEAQSVSLRKLYVYTLPNLCLNTSPQLTIATAAVFCHRYFAMEAPPQSPVVDFDPVVCDLFHLKPSKKLTLMYRKLRQRVSF